MKWKLLQVKRIQLKIDRCKSKLATRGALSLQHENKLNSNVQRSHVKDFRCMHLNKHLQNKYIHVHRLFFSLTKKDVAVRKCVNFITTQMNSHGIVLSVDTNIMTHKKLSTLGYDTTLLLFHRHSWYVCSISVMNSTISSCIHSVAIPEIYEYSSNIARLIFPRFLCSFAL